MLNCNTEIVVIVVVKLKLVLLNRGEEDVELLRTSQLPKSFSSRPCARLGHAIRFPRLGVWYLRQRRQVFPAAAAIRPLTEVFFGQ